MRRTLRWCSPACLCVLAILVVPQLAKAQSFGLSGFGAKLGYINPEHQDGTLAVGAHLEFERSGSQVHLLPNVMYWKSDDLSDLSANADLYYHFIPEGLVTPYLGAGLGINFFSDERTNDSDADLGANLFGGLRFPGTTSHYFVEGRFTGSDVSQFSLLGGFTLHR